MSRFSPRVLPVARTSILEALAGGAEQGINTYDATKSRVRRERMETEDRGLAQEDRRRRITRESEQDEIAGIGPAPVTPIGPTLDDEPLAEALASAPGGLEGAVAPGPRSSSGVPGGFDAFTGAFETPVPRIAPRRLSSGRIYDPQSVIDREMAAELQRAEMGRAASERTRETETNRRLQMLLQLGMADEEFDELDPAYAQGLAQSQELFEWALQNLGGARGPRRGTAEYEKMIEAEAAARGRGGAAGRGTGGGTATINAQLSAAERELARAIREAEALERRAPSRGDETYGGMATLITGRDAEGREAQIPVDPAAGARFQSDSTAHADRIRRAREARETAEGRVSALRRQRGDNRPISQGGGQAIESPAVQAELQRELSALDERVARVKANPRATPEFLQRYEAAAAQERARIVARYRE